MARYIVCGAILTNALSAVDSDVRFPTFAVSDDEQQYGDRFGCRDAVVVVCLRLGV